VPYLVDTVIPPSEAARRDELRPAHLAYLEANVGRILAAGAKLEEDGSVGDGSFYLLDFDTLDGVEEFLRNEPYDAAGIVHDASIVRVRKGFFDGRRVVQA
jgi:uncharacterized protein YciI